MRHRGIAIAALASAGALLAGGGAALAGEGQGQATRTSGERCLQLVERIAERQGISVVELEAKLRERALARIDAALAAGRIDESRATAFKTRVNAWKLCDGSARKAVANARHAKRLHARVVASMVAGAVGYLDVTRVELREDLRDGKSLRDIAVAKSKSVTGLKTAMLERIATRLDKAVAAGTITDDRRDALLERYGKLADRLIDAKRSTTTTS